MEAMEINFDLRLVTFEIWFVYSVLTSFKFNTKVGGVSLQSINPE